MKIIAKIIKEVIICIRIILLNIICRNNIKIKNKINKIKIYDSEVGRYNYIGPGVIINNTKIGNYCSIAAYSQIGGMEHPIESISTSTYLNDKIIQKRTIIENDVWIGAGVYIKSGIRIGQGAVIGAGSIVTKDINPYCVAYGVPAIEKRKRFIDKKINNIINMKYWIYKPRKARTIIKREIE